jgi:hypothetical protein
VGLPMAHLCVLNQSSDALRTSQNDQEGMMCVFAESIPPPLLQTRV